MNNRIWKFAALAAAVLASACDRTENRDTQRDLLPAGDVTQEDPREAELIALTRDLAAALASPDSAALGNLLAGHFRVTDTRPRALATTSPSRGDAPLEYSYLDALAGRVEAVPAAVEQFRVFGSESGASVYGIGSEDALRARWTRTDNTWKADQLILMSANSAREMISRGS